MAGPPQFTADADWGGGVAIGNEWFFTAATPLDPVRKLATITSVDGMKPIVIHHRWKDSK